VQCYPESRWFERGKVGRAVIDLQYSLVIEATTDPNFFGFYSPDLEGFTGVGHSIEDCLYKARWGMEEHIALLREQRLPVPALNPDPTVVIHNERRAEAVA
jgi:predicted RNase H-like HicB family nuclease